MQNSVPGLEPQEGIRRRTGVLQGVVGIVQEARPLYIIVLITCWWLFYATGLGARDVLKIVA